MKLIIGASSGLGLKLAFLLAYKGFDIIICSSNIEDLKKIKSHIENIYGVKVYLFELNLSDLNKSFEVYSENIWETIEVENTEDDLFPFLVTIPLQKLAYYSALKKGYDIDKPRNLAKSVTVE